jgi:hypothetical protein
LFAKAERIELFPRLLVASLLIAAIMPQFLQCLFGG